MGQAEDPAPGTANWIAYQCSGTGYSLEERKKILEPLKETFLGGIHSPGERKKFMLLLARALITQATAIQ